MLMGAVDPPVGESQQPFEVGRGREGLGLEAGELAVRGRRVVPGPPADHGAHRRVEPQSLGVIEDLVPSQAAGDRLP
jgi:hypothetical protein